MKLLLDTCTFLWVIVDHEALSGKSRTLFRDPTNIIFLSVVSGWEIMLKYSMGKLQLPTPTEHFLVTQRSRHSINALPLEETAIVHLPKLPALHKDPFDRMLICQAIEHELTLLTPDPLITQYAVRTAW
ncbi:MAG: twitching motility protein PilT [Nitrospirales bacterium]|nr:MAG: twitching motility protein PilT [Nitrospirales bacterium]